MRRERNWDVALAVWAREQVGQPWTWGETDCGSLVLAAYEVMYGERPPGLPGDWYHDLRGAVKMQRDTGGVEGVLRELGAEVVPPGFVQRGDVAVLTPEEEELPAAAVVLDYQHVLEVSEEEGVRLHPLQALREYPDATFYRLPFDG